MIDDLIKSKQGKKLILNYEDVEQVSLLDDEKRDLVKANLTQFLNIGGKVHYQPFHYSKNKWENGLIKEIRDGVVDAVWVVYKCGGNWDRYKDYTSAKTNLRDLKFGWRY